MVSGHKRRQGKVRDIYNLGDGRLVIIATDRISAFDVVMENGIPDKGKVLTALTKFWLQKLQSVASPHHLVSTELDRLPEEFQRECFEGRVMVCREAEPLPVECVVRGYLAGSGWKEYQKTGQICGIKLPSGLKQCDKLPEPIFTPATKAQAGHDENITFEDVCKLLANRSLAESLRDRSINLYRKAHDFALKRGVIIADTKFEFGRVDGTILLIDEVLTPDSSRFWPVDEYEPGHDQVSFDKQFVRNYLETLCENGKWDKTPPGPRLPDTIVAGTWNRYRELYRRLTRKDLKP